MNRVPRFPRPAVLPIALLVFLIAGLPAYAADNQATGDIGGVAADLTDSNVFTINSSTLALTKTAFLTDGTELTSGATVPRGTRVRFMIYIDNSTGVAVNDVNMSDVLDAAFSYVSGSIKTDNSQATGATTAAVYAAVNATTALDDGVNGTDEAGISGTTVSAGSGAGNAQLDIAASSVWAMLIETTVQ